MDDKPYAFVLTQIGAENSPERVRTEQVAKYIVQPACTDSGLEMMRADKDPMPGRITVQIVRRIVESQVVIADLTGRNANVYYELGIAHAFNRPVVALCDDPKDLPFDLKDERAIVLGEFQGQLSAAAAEAGQAALLTALRMVLAEDYKPGSIVTEAAAARNIDELAPENPVFRELQSLREEMTRVRSEVLGELAPSRAAEVTVLRRALSYVVRQYNIDMAALQRILLAADTRAQHEAWVEELMLGHVVPIGGIESGPENDLSR